MKLALCCVRERRDSRPGMSTEWTCWKGALVAADLPPRSHLHLASLSGNFRASHLHLLLLLLLLINGTRPARISGTF